MKPLTAIGNFFSRQRVPASHIRFRHIEKETRTLIAYAIFYILIGYVIGMIIQRDPRPIMGATQFNQDLWYSGLFKIGFLLIIPSVIYFGIWGYKFRDLLLGIKPAPSNILAAIVMMTLGFFLNASHLEKIREQIPHTSDLQMKMFLGILMPLLTAGIPEELFFRGYLQTRLEKKWNRLAAITVTSILFAAWHLPSRYLLSKGVEGQAGDWGQVLLQTGLPVFIISMLFGYHWSRNRNIVILILTHWAVDILPSVSSYLGIAF